MDHFVGLDVSIKETSVCIVDDTGKVVRQVKVASEPEALLTSPAYRVKRIGLEAGPLSQNSGDRDHSFRRIATTHSDRSGYFARDTLLMSPPAMLLDCCRRIFTAVHRGPVLLELLRGWNSLRY